MDGCADNATPLAIRPMGIHKFPMVIKEPSHQILGLHRMTRRLFLFPAPFIMVLLLAACLQNPAPTPTPAPTPITTPFAGIREDPQRLTLIQTDLPDGFRRIDNTTLHAGHNAVLFMNPDAVKGEAGQEVLGVVDEITVYEFDADARDAFEEDLRTTETDIAKDVAASNDVDGENILVDRYDPDLVGADLLRAFKVRYQIGDQTVYEYRYQFMVSNAIANVIVTTRAQEDGGESEEARTQADAIAQAQLDKLNDYRAVPQ